MFQNFKFRIFFSFHFLLIFSQVSTVVQALPPLVLLRAKESKASITNKDEERVIREGQPELPPPRTRDLGFFFYVFYVYKVQCGAGRGSGDEKILNLRHAPPLTVWQKSKPCPQIST
jgi:hypothetical protein